MTQKLKIGFPGSPGAHSEQAIKSSLSSGIPLTVGCDAQLQQYQIVPMPSTDLDNLFAAITNIPQPIVDLCYIPLENTLSGTFSNVYEMLLKYHSRVNV
jgi:prephenate dehydratase